MANTARRAIHLQCIFIVTTIALLPLMWNSNEYGTLSE